MHKIIVRRCDRHSYSTRIDVYDETNGTTTRNFSGYRRTTGNGKCEQYSNDQP